MVLKITVKTLDSRNYDFEADDSWTVQQFKDHIESTVNVLPNEQRLIFCGRVFQNDKKLSDYDCNGKVIHLVRRPPPVLDDQTQGSSTAADTNNNDRLRMSQTLEGSVTITTTAPIVTSSTNSRHQAANATIVITAEPGQGGIHIPVSFAILHTRESETGSQPSQPGDLRSDMPSSQQTGTHTTNHTTSVNLPHTNTNGEPMQSSSGSTRYNRNQLAKMMQDHPDWVSIIEADINVMEQSARVGADRPSFFSDAYLSSIPRKRRRLFSASPERVLILQPHSSQAIANLLRRAITNSSVSTEDSLDVILNVISSDPKLQEAYEDHLKAAVKTRLNSDFDYCPQKFENSGKYFK